MRVVKNVVLFTTIRPKRKEAKRNGCQNCIIWRYIISAPQEISIGVDSNEDGVGGSLGGNRNACRLYYWES